MDDDCRGCEKEVNRLEADLVDVYEQLAEAQHHAQALEVAVAIALTELNTFEIGWGRATATNMIRQLLRDWPVVQEIPPEQRNMLRDRILPPLAEP